MFLYQLRRPSRLVNPIVGISVSKDRASTPRSTRIIVIIARDRLASGVPGRGGVRRVNGALLTC